MNNTPGPWTVGPTSALGIVLLLLWAAGALAVFLGAAHLVAWGFP
jgi:hypothetical protein